MAYKVADKLPGLPSSIHKRMDLADPLLKALQASAKDANAQNVANRDKLYEIADQYELSFVEVFLCKRVGTNPRNRGGGMLEPSTLPSRTEALVNGGFSFSEVSRACATQRAAGEEGDREEARCAKLASRNPFMMKVTPGTLEIFSLTVSHTKEVVRSCSAGVPCTIDYISENGVLSASIVSLKCPPMGKAIDKRVPMEGVLQGVRPAPPVDSRCGHGG